MKRFRHHIKLQHNTGPAGDNDPTYTDFATGIDCSIMNVGGTERISGRQVQAETTVVIDLRFLENVDPSMRAINEHTLAEYAIVAAYDPDNMLRMMRIEAREVLHRT